MNHGWTRFASWVGRVNEQVGRVLWYLTLAMILAGTYNAVTRYLARASRIDEATATGFGQLLQWIGTAALAMNSNMFIELQWYLFSVIFLLGAAYTLKADAHVRVDVFYARMSRRARAWINLCGATLFLVPFCVLMVCTSWPVVVDAVVHLEGSPDPGGLPRYPLLAVIPVAFVLLLLQGIAQAVHEITFLRIKSK